MEIYLFIIGASVISFILGYVVKMKGWEKVHKTIVEGSITLSLLAESLKKDADGNVTLTPEEFEKLKEAIEKIIKIWN